MPSDLSNYLATRYLVADPKPPSSSNKKRKRKHDPSSSAAGLLITDDSETGWTRSANGADDDDDPDALLLSSSRASGGPLVAGTSAEFRKAKQSAWKVVGAPALQPREHGNHDRGDDDEGAAAADAIVASAAAESKQGHDGADEDADGDAPAVVMMSDGTHAGLQSAAMVAAQLARRKKREEAEFARLRATEREAETVYRDATGRRVDAGMKRAEARRELAEAAEKEVRAKEALRGDVQVEEARRRREALEDARLLGVGRRADDEDMNRELKAQARWGDTMAEFVGRDKQGEGGGGAGAKSGGKGKDKGKPSYQGAAPPNRYGIRPGYRWDGVDRGNGFEAQRFKAINRVERNKGLEYNWQMDE